MSTIQYTKRRLQCLRYGHLYFPVFSRGEKVCHRCDHVAPIGRLAASIEIMLPLGIVEP